MPQTDQRGVDGPAPSARSEQLPLPATTQLIRHAREELGRVIAGQTQVIEEVLIAVLCQGHALLEGVPGIAKTLIVKALGRLLGLGFQRVQATPDLMPADILGTTILRQGSDTFTFHAGPVFTDLLHGGAASYQRRGAPAAAWVVYRIRHAEPGGL